MSDRSRITLPNLRGSTRGQTARRWTALVLLACYLPACASWHTASEPVPVVLAEHPATLRVTRLDGTKIKLEHPVLQRDTLQGQASSYTWATIDGPSVVSQHPVSIPLNDVRVVARHSGGAVLKTLGLILFGGIVALGIACRKGCLNTSWGSGGSFF